MQQQYSEINVWPKIKPNEKIHSRQTQIVQEENIDIYKGLPCKLEDWY